MLLISSFLASANSINIDDSNEPNTQLLEDIAELPNWEIGYYWIYDMHFDFTLSGVVGIDGLDPNDPDKGIINMKVEVITADKNNDEYTLEIAGDLKVGLEIFGLGLGEYNADLTGAAHIEMSTLAIKDFQFSASGEFKLVMTRECDFNFAMTFDSAFNFFDFPIDPADDPWPADTYATLNGDIHVHGLYETDFETEGAFEDEMISFVKNEEIIVPAGTFNTFLISGSLGPSNGGWSKLWYSRAAKYLVRVDEKINDWEGVDAQLDLILKATNVCGASAQIEIDIHKIKQLDEIDPLPFDEADWSYYVKVDTGENWEKQSYDCTENHDEIVVDNTHGFNVITKTPEIIIKLWERDWPESTSDLADISSIPGEEVNDNIDDSHRNCIFYCKYDIIDDEIIKIDNYETEGGYFITRGDLPPDGSTNTDENDAKVWFKIRDNYEPPKKPKKPQGSSSGSPGEEYTYTSGASDPSENQRFYKFDWGDSTFSAWLGPYNAGDTVEASHAWATQGNYNVRVKARDVFDVESVWSDPLTVTMPRNKAAYVLFHNLFENFPLLEKILTNFLRM